MRLRLVCVKMDWMVVQTEGAAALTWPNFQVERYLLSFSRWYEYNMWWIAERCSNDMNPSSWRAQQKHTYCTLVINEKAL
jgi:hypothetical protein